MADFGNGYGSECHLLRYLGRHRTLLDDEVCRVANVSDVEWLDFPFASTWPPAREAPRSRSERAMDWPDAEWLSLDFLPGSDKVVRDWHARWPHGRGVMNWDAVGRAMHRGRSEWLLVEAKAHLAEIGSDCQASAPASLKRIERVLSQTKRTVGAAEDHDWLNGYYQYANRLAVLDHLTRHNVGARLVFIYFCGNHRRDQNPRPAHAEDWKPGLDAQDRHLGLKPGHALSDRLHKVFLPVWWGNRR